MDPIRYSFVVHFGESIHKDIVDMSFMYFSGHPELGMSSKHVKGPGARKDGVLVLSKSKNADTPCIINALSWEVVVHQQGKIYKITGVIQMEKFGLIMKIG